MILEYNQEYIDKKNFLIKNQEHEIIDKEKVNKSFKKDNNKMSENEAEEFLSTFACETLYLFEYFNAYLSIFKHKKINIKKIECGIGFFNITERALKELIILTISKICDENSKVGNLRKYIQFLKRNIFTEIKNGENLKFEYYIINHIEERYKQQKDLIEKIRILRNQRIAHNDDKKSLLDDFTETGITTKSIEDFLIFCFDIICFSIGFYNTEDKDLMPICINEPKIFLNEENLKELLNLKNFSRMQIDLDAFIDNIN